MCSTTSRLSLQANQPSFKVFVNYPLHVKREDIKDHLRSCGLSGNVNRLNMFYDERKKSKGCGYIEVVPPSFGRSAIGVLNGSGMRAKKYKRRNKSTKRESGTREECSTPSEETGRVKVFVGAGVGQKLPPRIEASHLEHHMRLFKSALDEVVIATDPRMKQSKGYGFVFFKSQRAADAAIKKLNGSTLHGCNLSFELSKPKESHAEVTSTLPVDSSSSKVFVGALVESRLPSSIQTVHLEAHLWQFEHTIQEAFIVMDLQTQQSKGYGFAIFKSKSAAEAAIKKLGGSVLHGCQLKLEIAKPSHSHSNTHRQSSQSQRCSATVKEPTTDGSGRRIHIGAESGDKLPNTIQSFTSGATVEAGQSQTRGRGIPSNSVSGTTFVGNLPHSVQAKHLKQQRMVRRSPAPLTPSSPTSVQWKFVNDSSRWTPYIPPDSQAIETMYQSQTPGHCTINRRVYTFDFAQMCQINTATSFKRPIKRLLVSSVPKVKVPDQPGEKKERITLRGARANLIVAKKRIDDKLEGALSNGDITFPSSIEGKVLTIIQQYKLDFNIRSTGDQKGRNKRVTFNGLSSSVNKATSAIQEEVINYHITAAEKSTVGAPVEWEPQTQQNLMLCAAGPGIHRVG